MFPNYAGRADVDNAIADELRQAGIEAQFAPESMRGKKTEVQTVVFGALHGWWFIRFWHYWVCQGIGLTFPAAKSLHERHGQVVRVDGDCTCPAPHEAVGLYHVDSQEGLNALADAIREIATFPSTSSTR